MRDLTAFEEVETLPSTENIRILLVGFSIDDATERMISWMSEQFGMPINAMVLRYIKTHAGDELLVRTTIIPEELDIERANRQSRRKTLRSDEPGNYSDIELETRLRVYLAETNPVIPEVLLPLCLCNPVVTREQLVDEIVKTGKFKDRGKAGMSWSATAGSFSVPRKDFVRQILKYEVEWGYKKTNFRIEDRYKDMVRRVLSSLGPRATAGS